MTPEDAIRELLERNAYTMIDKDGAFCTGFVVFAEFVDSNNEYYTFSLIDEKAPLWRLQGLVDYLRETELVEEVEEEVE